MTYQAPTIGLHSPSLHPFLQISTDYLMLAQSRKFGVNCCSSGLTHPAACTRARVPLTFGHVYRPPPFTQFAQKGWQSTGLELKIPVIYLKFCGCGPEKNWRSPPPKAQIPSHSTPPSPIQPIYIHLIAQCQNSDYMFFLSEVDMLYKSYASYTLLFWVTIFANERAGI
jgi:hypothetical protein